MQPFDGPFIGLYFLYSHFASLHLLSALLFDFLIYVITLNFDFFLPFISNLLNIALELVVYVIL